MSRLSSSSKKQTGIAGVAQELSTRMKQNGSEFATEENARQVCSLESLTETDFGNAARDLGEMQVSLRSLMVEKTGLGVESFSSAQMEAGAIAAMALGNPDAFADLATKNMYPSSRGQNVTVVEAPGGMDYRHTPALEAFNEAELKAHMPWSVVFNVMAARQGEFGEAFYPTVVLTPDQAGLDVTVRRAMVFNEVRHNLNGKATNFGKRNLIDAVSDYTILLNDSNLNVPMVVPSGTNQNTVNYVSNTIIPPYEVTLDQGQQTLTAPLAFGIGDIDFLGLCQRNDIQFTGTFDSTDSLDPLISLQTIYLQINAPAMSGATPPFSIIPFDVSSAPRNQWNKSVEGSYRELNLNYQTQDLPLNAATLGLGDQANPTALAVLQSGAGANWTIRIGVNISGTANVEFGSLSAQASTPQIVSITNVDPVTGAVTDVTNVPNGGGTNLSVVTAALGTMSFVGFDVYSTRSNANRRTRGLLLDNTEFTERYTIQLGAPLTIPAPTNTNRESSDMTTLINAARIRNDNNAITTLLAYADTLSEYNLASLNRSVNPVPAIEGMGRYVLVPFYEEDSFDAAAEINSIKSQERAEDVRAVLVNKIRDVAYRMYRDSHYQPALDAATGGTGERPIVLIGTDPVTAKFLMVTGDTRTLGILFDTKVVVSYDQRLYNGNVGTIFITLTRANQVGADPLCFGEFAWIPELASTVTASRNGATIKETMVQPRTRHINNSPILAKITVKNLDIAASKSVALPMWSAPAPL